MSFDTRAVVTEEGERRRAEAIASGKSFKVVAFGLGNQGHDPNDPRIAISPDPATKTLAGMFFGPKPISGVSYANDFCPVFECYLDYGEAVAQFSSIALFATIVYSEIPNDPELNTTFIYAIAHFARKTKTDLEQRTIRIGVQG